MTGASLLPELTVLEVPLSLFFLQLAIILTTCRGLSILGEYFDQPSVVFEIVGGVLLGPSALGKVKLYKEAILPEYSLETLNIVANFGLQLYLFLVGLELDLKILMEHSAITTVIALSGIVVPFGIGLAISALLYNLYLPDTEDETRASYITFAVFIGTSMAVTALPVLARILKEQDLMYTRPGFVALGAAVITDAIAWILLVVAISLANSVNTAIAGWTFLGITIYAMVAFTIGKWLLQLIVLHVERWSTSDTVMNNLLTMCIVLMLLSAALVAQLGIDPIVGSFIFGVIVPRHTHLYRYCVNTLENFVLVLLLPLFFAISGLRTDVTVLKPYPDLLVLLLVCAGATLGKFFGVGIAARACGISMQESSVLAVLMNTRGLVELIVLNIGRSLSVLDGRIFSILVLMCLFTTFMTCPILQYIYPARTRKYLKEVVGAVLDGDIEVGLGADHLHSHSSGCTSSSNAGYGHNSNSNNNDNHSLNNTDNTDGGADGTAAEVDRNAAVEHIDRAGELLHRISSRSNRISWDGRVADHESSETKEPATARSSNCNSNRSSASFGRLNVNEDVCSDVSSVDLLQLGDIHEITKK